MKKLYFLLLPFLFFLSACSADYNAPNVYEEEFLAPLAEDLVIEESDRTVETEFLVEDKLVNEVVEERAEVKTSVPLSNDNYYTNVDGETVHSPAFAPSVPAGASAICKDGTYSFSQNRRGTCSGHGGVASWL